MSMQTASFEPQIKKAEIDLEAGRLEQAARALIPIVKAEPENYDARQHLTTAYYGLGYFEEAVDTFRPNFPRVPEVLEKYTYFGNLCLTAGLAEEAATYFKKADAMSPGNPDIKTALGESYIPLGKITQAEEYFHAALAINRHHIRALCLLAEITPQAMTREQKSILEKTLEDESQDLAVRADTGFVLGGLLQQAKKYNAAFKMFKKSNTLQEQTFTQTGSYFQSYQEQKKFTTVTEFFTPDFLKSAPKAKKEITPIFIIGLPRSGTTLVEQIIGAHPSVYAGGEQKTLGELYLRMERMAEFSPGEAKEDILARITAPWREDYFQRMHFPRGQGLTHTTDKMPLNFPYVGTAAYAVPDAKFVLIRRNPLDNCLSMYFKPLTASYPASVSLSALGAFYNLFESYNVYWQKALVSPMYELQYEDLINDPESETRKLIDYIDLPWNGACLKPHEGKRAVKTMSNVQIREPISGKYINQWKNYEAHIAPLKEALDKHVLARYGLKK